MSPEEKEEGLILFAVLQDIANELRRIKRERRTTEKDRKQAEALLSENASEFPSRFLKPGGVTTCIQKGNIK